MADDDKQQTWTKWGMTKLGEQGIGVLVLIAVSVAFGCFIWIEMPKRDAVFVKALSDQVAKFEKMFEDRDVRTLAYRTKADERHAEERKQMRVDCEVQYSRLRDLMLALQKQGIAIEKRIEAMQ